MWRILLCKCLFLICFSLRFWYFHMNLKPVFLLCHKMYVLIDVDLIKFAFFTSGPHPRSPTKVGADRWRNLGQGHCPWAEQACGQGLRPGPRADHQRVWRGLRRIQVNQYPQLYIFDQLADQIVTWFPQDNKQGQWVHSRAKYWLRVHMKKLAVVDRWFVGKLGANLQSNWPPRGRTRSDVA